MFVGNPWLWARLDRKPNKVGDRKFKKFQSQQKQNQNDGNGDVVVPKFQWDVAKDFKVHFQRILSSLNQTCMFYINKINTCI